jgi:hypothetical protein
MTKQKRAERDDDDEDDGRAETPKDVPGKCCVHRDAGAVTDKTSAFQRTGGMSTDGMAPVSRALMAIVAFGAAK